MATQPSSTDCFSVTELTVRGAQRDLLDVDPLDFGPDAPTTRALEAERGPQPGDVRANVATSSPLVYLDSSALVKLSAGGCADRRDDAALARRDSTTYSVT